jgi:arylsulfatase A-like enzyme
MTGKYPSRSASAIDQSTKHPNAWRVTEGMGVSNEQLSAARVGDGSRVFVYNHFNTWIGKAPRTELTVAHALREAGFRTGLVGKYHLSWRQADPKACSMTPAEYDDERSLIAETAGFDFVDALHTCNIQSSTKKVFPPKRRRPRFLTSVRIGKGDLSEAKLVFAIFPLVSEHPPSVLPPLSAQGNRFSHNPEFTLHHAQRFVNESTDAKTPWFLYMGLTLPHPPNARLALQKYSVADNPAGPGRFGAQEQAAQRRAQWRQSVAAAADDAVTAAVAGGFKGSWEMNSHNSAAVVWLDAVVGEWLGWLRAKGELDKTLVVFTSDHGMMGKRTCNEHGTRVPLILRGPPSLVRPGTTVHQLVALHDLPVTFLHLARAKVAVGLGLARAEVAVGLGLARA